MAGGFTNRFRRKSNSRSVNSLYYIATEGAETEKRYFEIINNVGSKINENVSVRLVILDDAKKHRSQPRDVLKCMQQALKGKRFSKSDRAWLVIDHDGRNDSDFQPIIDWLAEQPRKYFLALSNPCFEQWLLWHFNDSTDSAVGLRNRLRTLGIHEKASLPASSFTKATIIEAIDRAKKRDNPPCSDWPRTNGSTVYKLLESIFQLAK